MTVQEKDKTPSKVVDLKETSKKRKRSATDVLSRTEAIVAGGVEYQLTHQTLFQSREWRKGLGDMLRMYLPQMSGMGIGSNMTDFIGGMSSSLEEVPEAIFQLLREYDDRLDWDKIEKEIYPDELDTIFTQIVEAVFPLAKSLSKAAGLTIGA